MQIKLIFKLVLTSLLHFKKNTQFNLQFELLARARTMGLKLITREYKARAIWQRIAFSFIIDNICVRK